MEEYIVAVEYRISGEKKVNEDYKKCETLDEAKQRAALWVKIFKANCDLFDVAIYEVTNY